MISVVIAAGQVAKNSLSEVANSFVTIIVAIGAIRILVEILRPTRRSRRRRRKRELTAGEARFILDAVAVAVFMAVEVWLWRCNGIVGRLLALLIPLVGVSGLVAILKRKKQSPPAGPVSATESEQSNSRYESRTSSKVDFPILFPNEDEEIAVSVGEKGEAMVRDVIEDLPSDRYVVLHDVWLPMEAGGETQIDHVIVSPYGMFIIETKNWKGTIYADEKSRVWTKYNCGQKMCLKNPTHQNFKHIVSIREKFFSAERDFVFGVVAMCSSAEFKYGVPNGVVYYNELGGWIMGHVTPCIKAEQIPEIVSAIQEWSLTVSEDARRRHCGK